MIYRQWVSAAVLAVLAATGYAQHPAASFDQMAQQILTHHYEKYKDREYFSGASLSIGIPGQTIKNYYIGHTAQSADSKAIAADTLFQIGSITKSFTAAILLQLEKEKKLSLQDRLQKWLPVYSKWETISLQTLLNMTSGLPNYSDTPAWSVAEARDLAHVWTNTELVDFVYPRGSAAPPLKKGYFYTNTGYVLAAMITEKATGQPFKNEFIKRTIERAHLKNTFYPEASIAKEIKSRLAHGYAYNPYDNPMFLGRDMYDTNLSWAGAAGGVIANSEDIINWIRALFIDNAILDASQKAKLTQLISTETGQPISTTNQSDTHGFGLGVAEAYDKDMGRYWFYEGMTLGYRALYLYTPCNGVIIASIFNSAVDTENDHAGALMKETYKWVIVNNPKLICKTGAH